MVFEQVAHVITMQLMSFSFGLAPNIPLNVPTVHPNQSFDVLLPLNVNGPVQRMEPPNNLQVWNRSVSCAFVAQTNGSLC